MVDLQLAGRGIADERVLAAFRTVPREAFVPPDLVEFAYRDAPLPIGEEQTISQPYIVAVTVAALDLEGGERVLGDARATRAYGDASPAIRRSCMRALRRVGVGLDASGLGGERVAVGLDQLELGAHARAIAGACDLAARGR